MVYFFASVCFFFLSVRSILFWTTLWQKSGYRLRYLTQTLRSVPKKMLFPRSLLFLLSFFLIAFYGIVIVNDRVTVLFYGFIIVWLFTGAYYLVREIREKKMIRPVFSMKVLFISIVALFLVSFFYTMPLIDPYLWLLILLLFLPLVVAFLVFLLAFPSEILEDFVLEKTKKLLKTKKELHIIAVIGQQACIEKNLFTLLKSSPHSVLRVKEHENLLQMAHALQGVAKLDFGVLLFHMPSRKEEMKKILQLCKPQTVIVTDTAIAKTMHKYYEILFSRLPKQTRILLPIESSELRTLLQKGHKMTLLYGMQKYSQRKKVFIHGQVESAGKDVSHIAISLGAEVLQIKLKKFSENKLLYQLPAFYIARAFGVPVGKLRAYLLK